METIQSAHAVEREAMDVKFMKELTDVDVEEGEIAIFECEVTLCNRGYQLKSFCRSTVGLSQNSPGYSTTSSFTPRKTSAWNLMDKRLN